MTENHPITPPPNLVQEWYHEADNQIAPYYVYMAHQAAGWGADQELEACCADLRMVLGPNQADWLRSVRRPKPPSLKEQALDQLGCIKTDLTRCGMGISVDTIRRALESLPD